MIIGKAGEGVYIDDLVHRPTEDDGYLGELSTMRLEVELLRDENAKLRGLLGTCHNASYRIDESRFHCSECRFGCWVKDVADGRDKLPKFCPNCGRKVEA